MKHTQPIIAVAPIRYFDVHKTHNINKILKYIRLAKKKNADIVCFPESCITKKGCIDCSHRFIHLIREECRKNSIWCIITEDIRFGKKKYNTALLIDRNGEIKGSYKKINLYGDRTCPGCKVSVFETDFAKIGVAICWDLAFPDLFEKMKKMGAEIIFCPAYWYYDIQSHTREHKKRELTILRSLLLSRAFENVCYVALCNPLEKSKYMVSYSAIAGPHKILKEKIDEEGLITAKINLAEVHWFRKFYCKL